MARDGRLAVQRASGPEGCLRGALSRALSRRRRVFRFGMEEFGEEIGPSRALCMRASCAFHASAARGLFAPAGGAAWPCRPLLRLRFSLSVAHPGRLAQRVLLASPPAGFRTLWSDLRQIRLPLFSASFFLRKARLLLRHSGPRACVFCFSSALRGWPLRGVVSETVPSFLSLSSMDQ